MVSAVEAGVGAGRSAGDGRTTVGSEGAASWSVQRVPSHQLFLPVPSEYHPGALPGGGGGGWLTCSDPISETRRLSRPIARPGKTLESGRLS